MRAFWNKPSHHAAGGQSVHSHHGRHGDHRHTHGAIDPTITTSERGIWAIKWSFLGLLVTALLQAVVVYFSGSVALLADTIHNFGDSATAIPLWAAFALAKRKPSRRFTYGFGRVEDLAGAAVVLTILFSAIVAGYQTIDRFLHPRPVEYLSAVIAASVIGFVGNEAIAVFRIRVGKEIESAALIADGYHSRIDGWTSLAVLFGTVGVWLGFPLADPIVGLLITVAILAIVWQSAMSVFARMLDGVSHEIISDIEHATRHVAGIQDIADVRARWMGHRLHVELSVAVPSELSVAEGHEIAKEVRHQLLHQLHFISQVTVHVDPVKEAGEQHHRITSHRHDGLPAHSH